MNKNKLIFLLILLLIASLLRLYNLDRNEIWGDEAEVIILTKNLLRFGVPMGKVDNIYLTESGAGIGYGIKPNSVWVYHSWAQYYLLGLTAFFIGFSEFSARLPFVIFGILSLIFLYLLAKELYGERVALYSLFLSSFSISLINYTRQVRYYTLEVFGLLCFFYFFIKAVNGNELKNWIFSSLSFIFLFHANYGFSFPALITAIFYYLFHSGREITIIQKMLNKNFFIWISISFLLIAPWFLYAQPWKVAYSRGIGGGISKNTIFYLTKTLFERTPLPLVFIGFILIFKNFKRDLFLISWLITYLSFPLLINYTSPRGLLLFYPGLIILVALTLKEISDFLSSKSRRRFNYNYLTYLLLILISFTSIFNLQFYKVSGDENLNKIWSMNKCYSLVKFNIPVSYKNFNSIEVSYEPFKSEFFQYLISLREDFYGPMRVTADFLKENVDKDDIVVYNSGTFPMAYYTGFKVYYPHLDYYTKEFFLNITKEKNLWFVYRRYWGIPNGYKELVKDWIKNCKEYSIDAPDLIFSNNPDFPIYDVPEDLEKIKVYYCEKKIDH